MCRDSENEVITALHLEKIIFRKEHGMENDATIPIDYVKKQQEANFENQKAQVAFIRAETDLKIAKATFWRSLNVLIGITGEWMKRQQ
jgi:hypothetical protein